MLLEIYPHTYTNNAPDQQRHPEHCASALRCLLSLSSLPDLLDYIALRHLINMFYSETLLSKTGPLARVWLSANLERKLSKTHILQSDIESSVSAIVDQGQAPMALRLSGQLLLGVVRIYSRKARYLLDDCNEALLKIKMVRLHNFPLTSSLLTLNRPFALATSTFRRISTFTVQPPSMLLIESVTR